MNSIGNSRLGIKYKAIKGVQYLKDIVIMQQQMLSHSIVILQELWRLTGHFCSLIQHIASDLSSKKLEFTDAGKILLRSEEMVHNVFTT